MSREQNSSIKIHLVALRMELCFSFMNDIMASAGYVHIILISIIWTCSQMYIHYKNISLGLTCTNLEVSMLTSHDGSRNSVLEDFCYCAVRCCL